MLTQLLINTYIYTWVIFDNIISIIPGMDVVSEYVSYINEAILSIFGLGHSLLPSTFALFSTYVTTWLFIYVTYIVVRRFAWLIPGI